MKLLRFIRNASRPELTLDETLYAWTKAHDIFKQDGDIIGMNRTKHEIIRLLSEGVKRR